MTGEAICIIRLSSKTQMAFLYVAKNQIIVLIYSLDTTHFTGEVDKLIVDDNEWYRNVVFSR